MSTNSLGWEIQQYTAADGWTAITEPFATQDEAEQARADMDTAYPFEAKPRRIYEALA